MTTLAIKAIGFCVNYTEQGDRAFSLALKLARRNRLQFNIFHFLSDPYNPADTAYRDLTGKKREAHLIEMERTMRLYYDDRLADYLDAGFRLCENNEWIELHRCLAKSEFQTLVLACPSADAVFGRRSLLTFAGSFVCPVIVVGPGNRDLRFNAPARLVVDRLFGSDIPAIEEIEQAALPD